jgi:hypothetical protein
VTVNLATFDMDSLFPFYNDMTFEAGKTVDLADTSNYEGIPSDYSDIFADVNNTFDFQILWGAGTENIVSYVPGSSQVTLTNPGPIVFRVTLKDPNFVVGDTYRTMEFQVPPVSSTGGNSSNLPPTTAPGNPTDPQPGDEPGSGVSPYTISDGTPFGGDWYQLDWLGLYYWDSDGPHPNHIWNERFGWLYVPDPYLTSNPVWMYSYLATGTGELGWIFSRAQPSDNPNDPTDRYFARYDSGTLSSQWIWFSAIDEDDLTLRVFFDFAQPSFLLTYLR